MKVRLTQHAHDWQDTPTVWAVCGTPEQVRLGTQVEITDRAIDRLVYELYGLTEGEIRVVEGN
jgi:hypothetical protein